MRTLYDRIGGEAALSIAVERLYEKMLGDPELSPFFDGIDLAAQRKKLAAFLTYAFGGSEASGADLRAAHSRLVDRGLGDHHFDVTATYLRDTLVELGLDADLIDDVSAIVESTREDVLGRRS